MRGVDSGGTANGHARIFDDAAVDAGDIDGGEIFVSVRVAADYCAGAGVVVVCRRWRPGDSGVGQVDSDVFGDSVYGSIHVERVGSVSRFNDEAIHGDCVAVRIYRRDGDWEDSDEHQYAFDDAPSQVAAGAERGFAGDL